MSENTTGAAIQARREQVKGGISPQRLSAVDLRGAVEDIRETADLYKVYVPEWLIVFTSQASGNGGRIECEAFFENKFKGRVRDEDVRYEPSSTAFADEYPYRLVLRLPNTKGEFKYKPLAEKFVEDNGLTDAVIVARNSRDEYKLKDYSVKRIGGQA